MRWLFVLCSLLPLACGPDVAPSAEADAASLRRLFIMYSSNAPGEAPELFARFFTRRDLARVETLPVDMKVARRQRYALPATLRAKWNGEPGVRYWTRRGCGPDTPATLVYDPEYREEWTPPDEMQDLAASIREAVRLVEATGCHRFGIAPGASPFLGLDDQTCEVHLDRGGYRDLPWPDIDLVDIQAQRLLSEHCLQRDGLARYGEVVTEVAAFVRAANPDIEVVAQVSFRDNAPPDMKAGIAGVVDEVDGIFFSYPTTNEEIPCIYCTPGDLEELLGFLRRPSRSF